MKIKRSFVTNSSSTSFIIERDGGSAELLNEINLKIKLRNKQNISNEEDLDSETSLKKYEPDAFERIVESINEGNEVTKFTLDNYVNCVIMSPEVTLTDQDGKPLRILHCMD